MTVELEAAVGRWLATTTGCRFADRPGPTVRGGSIAHCVRWPCLDRGGDAFVKRATATELAALEAEAAGLEALRAAAALRVPRVLGCGRVCQAAVLALEWLDLSPALAAQPATQRRLGEGLAAQHRVVSASFGWQRANTIGATPQPNDEDDDWVRFYQRRRLGYQLDLARAAGMDPRIVERGRELEARCGGLFVGYRPVPSLLHGDFWGGNWSADAASGEPVVFDPAVYFGDREADVAMTRLFGGFGGAFYAAYDSAWPLDPGAAARRPLYDLYHLLNHWNLFGGDYARQASQTIEWLLAELG